MRGEGVLSADHPLGGWGTLPQQAPQLENDLCAWYLPPVSGCHTSLLAPRNLLITACTNLHPVYIRAVDRSLKNGVRF